MTGPEHYKAAEEWLDAGDAVTAQVHATLAVAAAVAMSHWNSPDMPMPQPDRLAWEKVSSERPAAQERLRRARAAEEAEFSGVSWEADS